ncbi:MAG TPA: hypothetical protein VNS46_08440, partial [Nocardioides sp.]|nr:hypothetical protein [Nocardioides sp.]
PAQPAAQPTGGRRHRGEPSRPEPYRPEQQGPGDAQAGQHYRTPQAYSAEPAHQQSVPTTASRPSQPTAVSRPVAPSPLPGPRNGSVVDPGEQR